MKKTITFIFIIMLLFVCLSGCSKQADFDESFHTQEPHPLIENSSTTIEVDYSDLFGDKNGCAIFYNGEQYTVYNVQKTDERYSPCSTFKIAATLIGLKNDIIQSENTKLGYFGKVFSRKEWNRDVTLDEAFKSSCVWYFKKIIDKAGEPLVQSTLKDSSYGNYDTSQWNGSGLNPSPELNGFWIESSLKISPKEQVDFLYKVFSHQSSFSKEHIEILRNVMRLEDTPNVYGKTGSGSKNGWFVGFTESSKGISYFAVHLDGSGASGKNAKTIALDIIAKHYS